MKIRPRLDLGFHTLHSNLVLFKFYITCCICSLSCLYIPIWFYSNAFASFCGSIHFFFTFQSGSIQIRMHPLLRPAYFTFQSGSIQILMLHCLHLSLLSLHSNLVLFKFHAPDPLFFCIRPLHSNLVLFK